MFMSIDWSILDAVFIQSFEKQTSTIAVDEFMLKANGAIYKQREEINKKYTKIEKRKWKKKEKKDFLLFLFWQ